MLICINIGPIASIFIIKWKILVQVLVLEHFSVFLFKKEKKSSYETIGCINYSVYVLSQFSRVRLFVTPETVARQAPLSMGFSRHERWSGLPCPPSGNLFNPGIERKPPEPPALAAGSLLLVPPDTTIKQLLIFLKHSCL